MQIMESPPWLRMLRIVIGGISITLSLIILASINSSILTAFLILSVVLLIVGIERISVGIAMSLSKRSRIVNIVLGLAIISFSIILMEFPIFASSILVVIGAVALLLSGIARIIQSASGKDSGLHRAFLMGVGILSIAVSILVIARPINLGLPLFAIMISIAFFVSGVEMMVLGITKR